MSGIANTARNVQDIRMYAANTYYASCSHRTNLVMLTQAQATSIRFTQDSGVPTSSGVAYVYANRTYTASARREVILSAGS